MPQVKRYEGDIREQPLQGGRSTAFPTRESSTALAVLGPMQKVAGALMQDEILRQDQIAYLEADRKAAEWENRTLYDPKNGLMNRRGKDSLTIQADLDKSFDETTQALRGELSNERQRIAFDRAMIARRGDLNKTVTRHVFTEMRGYEEKETENYINNSVQAAITNYQDPERIDLELDRAHMAVRDFARRNGMGPEFVKQKTAQVISKTQIGIIDRYLATGQDQAAHKYFEAVKGDISGDAISGVEAKLQVATVEGQGLRGAAKIWDAHAPKTDLDPVNVDKMMADARKEFSGDPKLLKAVSGYINERVNQHNASQRERFEARSSALWARIDEGASLPQVRSMPEFMLVSGQERERIRAYMVSKVNSERNQKDAEGDDALYYRLMTEASSDSTREKFMQTNLFDHRPNLSRSMFTQLVGIQAAMRKGDDKETAKLLASERQQERIISEALIGMKLDPTPNEKTKPEQVQNIVGFRRAVREAISQQEQRSGKNATDAEVQAIVDGMVIEGVTNKRWYWADEKKRVYQLAPGESISIKITDVPKAERTRIEEALVRNGRDVTDANVLNLYRERLMALRNPRRPTPAAPANINPRARN